MANTDYTSKKDADLRKELAQLREDIRTGRSSMGADGTDVKARQTAKKTIARIQTELSVRARQAAKNV